MPSNLSSIQKPKYLRTDKEIKDFIDSKEALTQKELSMFIYGYNSKTNSNKTLRYWDYVLATKDLVKLKQHKISREHHTDILDPIIERIQGIYRTDCRFNSLGHKSAFKLFKKIYGIDCCESTFRKYHKKVKNV